MSRLMGLLVLFRNLSGENRFHEVMIPGKWDGLSLLIERIVSTAATIVKPGTVCFVALPGVRAGGVLVGDAGYWLQQLKKENAVSEVSDFHALPIFT